MEVDWPKLVSSHDISLTPHPSESYRGLLLGNGDIGVSVFGPAEVLTLHVGKNDIWDYRDPMDEKRPMTHKKFLEKYADPNKPPVVNYYWDENADPWNYDIRMAASEPMPTSKPAGRIRIRNKRSGGAGYTAQLRLWNAEVTTDLGQHRPRLRTFVSYPRNLIIARYDPGGTQEFDIELARHKDTTGVVLTDPEFGAEGRDIWVRYKFPGDAANYPNGFEYVMYGRVIGGQSVRTETIEDFARVTQSWQIAQNYVGPLGTVEGVSVVHVRSSSPVTFLAAVFTSRDDAQPFERARNELDGAEKAGLTGLSREHRTWWHRYWRRSFVQLTERPFLNHVWFFSQYLLACSWRPGRLAPGLFGPWTREDCALFGNDYHWDYNMQQAVWGAYSSNHLEQAVAYNEAALALLPTAIADAKETYGIDGAKFFVSSYPRRHLHNPYPLLHQDKMMSLNGWVSHPTWWYYLYSQDMAYLRQQAYPLMRECAAFYEGYLTRSDDGKYDIWPTAAWDVDFTPHLRYNRNFPMDLSFVRYLMKSCIAASKILGIDSDRRPRWREIADNLRQYPTMDTTEGEVFTAYAGATSNYHFPLAAMMIFPGDDIGLHSSEELQDIGRRTLASMTYFGDEQLMKAVMRARLGIDDLAAFEKQLKITTRPNGTLAYDNVMEREFFWVHGSGNSIWINENLLQSYDGRIRVAPVKLQTGVLFYNLRTVGAFLVSGEMRPGGEITYVTMTSEAGELCTLVRPWDGEVRVRELRSLRPVSLELGDDDVSFVTRKGLTYVVDRPSDPFEKQPVTSMVEEWCADGRRAEV